MRRKLTDNDTFWDGAGREALLDRLASGGGSRIRVVAGPLGIGVSTLLGEAAMLLLDSASVVRIDGRETADRKGIMQALMTAFDADGQDFAEVLKEALADRPLVLVVDNAHLLQHDAMQMLALLRKRLGRDFSALLGGPDNFPERLYGTELEDADVLRPEPLGVQDCADFLEVVTGQTFDDEQLVNLHRQTEGLPGALLTAVAGDADAPVLRPPLPWKHIVAVVGLGLLVLVLWPRADPETEVRELALPGASREAPAEPTDPSADVEEIARTPVTEPLPRPAPDPDRASSAPVAPSEPEPEPEPELEPVRAPAAQATPDGHREPQAAETASIPEVVPAGSSPQLTGLAAELGYQREDWLLALPDERWLLQLTLTNSEDAARTLLDRVGRERGGYYRAQRDGRSVYVVVTGPYPSRAAALGARESLPGELAAAGPFPREVQAVRGELAGE